MRKGETIEVGWTQLQIPREPEGYSTLKDIAKKVHLHPSNLYKKLSDLKIPYIRAKTKDGTLARFYKD
jgi:hypothetical protein